MVAGNLQKKQLNGKAKDLNHSLLGVLIAVSDALRGRGLKVSPYSTASLQQFRSLSEDRKQGIIQNYSSYLDVIRRAKIDLKKGDELSMEEEIDLIRTSLDYFGLYTKDDDFSRIQIGDVVEIYNLEGTQLYRNFEFYRQCSYDLLTITAYEWFKLYERDESSTQKIFSTIEKVIREEDYATPYDIKPQTMREALIDSGRVFLTDFKYITPLFSKSNDEKVGFLHNVSSRLVLEGRENTSKINYLNRFR